MIFCPAAMKADNGDKNAGSQISARRVPRRPLATFVCLLLRPSLAAKRGEYSGELQRKLPLSNKKPEPKTLLEVEVLSSKLKKICWNKWFNFWD